MNSCDKPFKRFPVPAVGRLNPHRSQLLIKRSRFLSQACHCPSAQAAREFIAGIREINADATHNCWAFVAGAPGDTASIGSSDDGEPHGTAGRPMLQVLLHGGIGQICVVVSRWFGGIKLGTGGLVRAYQDSVLENLASLPVREAVPLLECDVRLNYAHIDAFKRSLADFEVEILAENYTHEAFFSVSLPCDRLDAFTALLAKISAGSAILTEPAKK